MRERYDVPNNFAQREVHMGPLKNDVIDVLDSNQRWTIVRRSNSSQFQFESCEVTYIDFNISNQQPLNDINSTGFHQIYTLTHKKKNKKTYVFAYDFDNTQ